LQSQNLEFACGCIIYLFHNWNFQIRHKIMYFAKHTQLIDTQSNTMYKQCPGVVFVHFLYISKKLAIKLL